MLAIVHIAHTPIRIILLFDFLLNYNVITFIIAYDAYIFIEPDCHVNLRNILN
jgi:hypothetical protein